jgi:hypothetical protein
VGLTLPAPEPSPPPEFGTNDSFVHIEATNESFVLGGVRVFG